MHATVSDPHGVRDQARPDAGLQGNQPLLTQFFMQAQAKHVCEDQPVGSRKTLEAEPPAKGTKQPSGGRSTTFSTEESQGYSQPDPSHRRLVKRPPPGAANATAQLPQAKAARVTKQYRGVPV